MRRLPRPPEGRRLLVELALRELASDDIVGLTMCGCGIGPWESGRNVGNE